MASHDVHNEFASGWDPSSLIGTRVGAGYEIRRLIGAGGMGHVYAAVNERLGGRECAVKVVTPDPNMPASAMTRFLGEARAVTALADPNIVDVFDAGAFADGRPFLLMEYISGGSLADYVERRGALPFTEAFHIIAQVASALHAAHSYAPPIIHRDVKLENVLIEQRAGFPLRAVLTDFGVAKLGDAIANGEKTGTMQMLGSPGYMAPEIVTGGGARDADARADVYSLATMMYLLLCGRLPYQGSTLYALIGQLMTNHPFPEPRELRAELPSGWNAVIMAALAHNREVRTPSVQAFVQQLAMGLPNGTEALLQVAPRLVDVRAGANDATVAAGMVPALRIASSVHDVPRAPKRRRSIIVAALGLLVGAAVGVVVAGGIAGLWQRTQRNTTVAAAPPTPLPAPVPVAPPTPNPLPAPAPVAPPTPATEIAVAHPAAVLAAAPPAPATLHVPPAASPAPPPTPPTAPAPKKSSSAVSGTGTLVVTAQTWAEVSVDGVARGTTPVRLKLAVGKHALLMTGASQSKNITVTIKPNATVATEFAW